MNGVQRCEVCGEPLPSSSRRYCSRSCRARMAAFWDFTTLGSILGIARWAGAPSQEELRRQYLRDRMGEALGRLSDTGDVLGEVLIEILEMEEESVGL